MKDDDAGYDPAADVTDDDIRDRELTFAELAHEVRLFARICSMRELMTTFPSLRYANVPDPWDALDFLKWTEGGHLTSGSLHAARFLLQVWNASTNWADVAAENGIASGHLSPFNVVAAFAAWDQAHRDAFLAWCRKPFFP